MKAFFAPCRTERNWRQESTTVDLAASETFSALSAHLMGTPHGQDPAVRQYADALRWMIAGNLEWSYITPRYNGPGHVWTGHTAATVISPPSAPSTCRRPRIAINDAHAEAPFSERGKWPAPGRAIAAMWRRRDASGSFGVMRH